MQHAISILATLPPCPPAIYQGGKGAAQAALTDSALTAVRRYRGLMSNPLSCHPQELSRLGENVIAVVDDETGAVLKTWPFGSVTASQIAAYIDALADVEYNPATGTYTRPDGTPLAPIIPGNGASNALFPGLFNFGVNWPAWVWLAIAAGAGYKASRSRGQLGKFGFGSIAAVAAVRALHRG